MRVQVDDHGGSRSLCVGYYFRDDPMAVAETVSSKHGLDVNRRQAIHHKLLELQQAAAARGVDVSPWPVLAAIERKFIPVAFPLLSVRAKWSKMQKKLKELALAVGAFTTSDIVAIDGMFDVLKDEARYHATRFAPTHFIVLQKLLEGMPLASLFPVIDLARAMLSHPDGRSFLADGAAAGGRLVGTILDRASEAEGSVVGAGAETVPWAVKLLCWRFVANTLHRGCQRSAIELLPRYLTLAAEHTAEGCATASKIAGDVSTALLNAASAWYALTSDTSVPPPSALSAELARTFTRSLLALLASSALSGAPAAARTRVVQAIGTLALARASDNSLLGPLIEAEAGPAVAPLASEGAEMGELVSEVLGALTPVVREELDTPTSASWVA